MLVVTKIKYRYMYIACLSHWCTKQGYRVALQYMCEMMDTPSCLSEWRPGQLYSCKGFFWSPGWPFHGLQMTPAEDKVKMDVSGQITLFTLLKYRSSYANACILLMTAINFKQKILNRPKIYTGWSSSLTLCLSVYR